MYKNTSQRYFATSKFYGWIRDYGLSVALGKTNMVLIKNLIQIINGKISFAKQTERTTNKAAKSITSWSGSW